MIDSQIYLALGQIRLQNYDFMLEICDKGKLKQGTDVVPCDNECQPLNQYYHATDSAESYS